MSYDITVENHHGDPFQETINITYNVAPMLRDAFKNEEGIRSVNGMGCEAAAPIILEALSDMFNRPEHYEPMNPKNGWGDAVGTRHALQQLYYKCKLRPDYKVVVE